MYNTNLTTANKNFFELVNMAIEDNEIVNVSTDNGNVIMINEADYNSLIETLYLSSNTKYKQSLIDGKNSSLSDCVNESDVEW